MIFWIIGQSACDIELGGKPKEPLHMSQDNAESAQPAEAVDYSAEAADEGQRLRRLQFMMNLVMQVISQDPKLTFEEASQMVADSRTAALAMFPGKELAYDLLYRPRFQRLMQERFRLQ
jgi:hypothetical protein